MTVTTGPRRVDLRSICALKPPGRPCTVRCWAGISRDVEQMTAVRRLVRRSDAAVLGRSVLERPCCSYVPRCRAVGTPELPPVFAPVSVAGVTLAPFLRYKPNFVFIIHDATKNYYRLYPTAPCTKTLARLKDNTQNARVKITIGKMSTAY